jgi:hypothetical protein
VIEQIRSSLDTYSVHDIHQMLNHATTPEEYIRAIHHVGVAAPQEYEPALVRHAAIWQSLTLAGLNSKWF